MADTLKPGNSLTANASTTSSNGRYTFIYQGAGNLVLYSPVMPFWDSKTNRKPAGLCIMQVDGNLVIYNPYRQQIWHSGTPGHLGSRLLMQNDGYTMIYQPDGTYVWSTNTMQHLISLTISILALNHIGGNSNW
jgi:hypothetical protein